MSKPVLQIHELQVSLPMGADRSHAVQGLSLNVAAGRTLCIVGESGSGKSVMAITIMGLLSRDLNVVGGSIKLHGEELLTATEARLVPGV